MGSPLVPRELCRQFFCCFVAVGGRERERGGGGGRERGGGGGRERGGEREGSGKGVFFFFFFFFFFCGFLSFLFLEIFFSYPFFPLLFLFFLPFHSLTSFLGSAIITVCGPTRRGKGWRK